MFMVLIQILVDKSKEYFVFNFNSVGNSGHNLVMKKPEMKANLFVRLALMN